MGSAALDVRPEASNLQIHRLARVGTSSQRLFGLGGLVEHVQGDFDGEFVGGLFFRQAGPAFALLQKRTEPTHSDENLLCFVALRFPDGDTADVSGVDLVDFVLQKPFETVLVVAEIERGQVSHVFHLATADGVEFVFHLGRESVVDQVWQMPFQQLANGKRDPSRHQGVAAFEDVISGKDRIDDRSVRAGAADALFFQLASQGGLTVTVGGLGRMTFGLQVQTLQAITYGYRRQQRLLVGQFGVRIVGAFHVRPQIPGEVDSPAADLEGCAVGLHHDSGSVAPGVGHLTGNGAFPDQIVKLEFVARKPGAQRLGEVERMSGRPNGFVGLLGILDFRRIRPGLLGEILGPVLRIDQIPCRLDRNRGQIRGVGSHVGNVARLVEALGNLHCLPGREAALAVCLLLQRAGGKRRGWTRSERLIVDRPHFEVGRFDSSQQLVGLLLREQQQRGVPQHTRVGIEIATGRYPVAVDRHQHGLELLSPRGCQIRQEVPISGRDKRHPLTFPLDDQTYRHALDTPGRELRTNLPPQQRGDLVAIEPVDDPSGLLGPDQVFVNLARGRQGFQDGFLGDLVKHQAMHRNLGLKDLAQVPTDGLAFTVFVSGQIEVLGPLDQVFEFFDLLGFLPRNDVDGLEIFVDVHSQVGPIFALVLLRYLFSTLWQVADVPDAGLYRIAASQEFADSAGLGR